MAQQKSSRNKRGGGGGPKPAPAQGASQDRYQKFLPEWMRGTNGAAPVRPPRPRRARPVRSVGGYTPGKSTAGE